MMVWHLLVLIYCGWLIYSIKEPNKSFVDSNYWSYPKSAWDCIKKILNLIILLLAGITIAAYLMATLFSLLVIYKPIIIDFFTYQII